MAVKYPNSVALSFTNFLLQVGTWRFTSAGRAIINTVNTASAGSTTVTQAQYNAYTQYTAFRYRLYLMHHALTA